MKQVPFKPGSLVLFAFLLIAGSCKRNNLEGDFASFKGKHTWIFTRTATGSGLSTAQGVFSPTPLPFSADIEFNGKSEILFYKNGELLSKNKFTIQSKETNAYGGKDLQIKLKGRHGMEIHEDKLKLHLTGDTVMEVERFPFPAIDKIENYKPNHRELVNVFRRM